MHQNVLQRQNGVGPLVSSKEQRALLVPVINRRLTAGQPLILFPHSVYIGFRLFVLLGKRSGDVSSIPWRVRGRLVSWANNFVGIQSCPTLLRRPAVRPDPTRPRYVRVLDSTGTAVLVPVINRIQTAFQLRISFQHSAYIGLPLFVFLGKRSSDVFTMSWRVRRTLVPWANNSVGIQSCSTPPRRLAVRPDPTRPRYVRVLDSTGTETKRRRSTGQQPGTKSASRPGDKPRVYVPRVNRFVSRAAFLTVAI